MFQELDALNENDIERDSFQPGGNTDIIQPKYKVIDLDNNARVIDIFTADERALYRAKYLADPRFDDVSEDSDGDLICKSSY